MVGSSQSLAGPNTMINAAVSEILSEVADRLEKSKDAVSEAKAIIKEFYSAHKRIIFNGNGYCSTWIEEAKERGLPNLSNTVEALSHLNDLEYVALFAKHNIFTPHELASRQEIYLETYIKQINIEAGLMIEMAKGMMVPSASRYVHELIGTIKGQKVLGFTSTQLIQHASSLSDAIDCTLEEAGKLEIELQKAADLEGDTHAQAIYTFESVVKVMASLRICGDKLEKLTDTSYWPYPTYEDMLFRL